MSNPRRIQPGGGGGEGAGNKPIVGFSFSKKRKKEKLSFENIPKETAIAKTHN
jgi:hypothetical protein